MDVSVIMPFCNEDPQIRFTLQDLLCELRDFCEFEIIAVNNYVNLVSAQGFEQDGGYKKLTDLSVSGKTPELRVFHFEDKLSHWNAKTYGLKQSIGKFIFFCDAHVKIFPGSLRKMISYYMENYKHLNGSIHLPICYLNDADKNALVYMTVYNVDLGLLHYRFTPYFKHINEGYQTRQIGCMSSCGMLIEREFVLDFLGGWPRMFGIYGGGENYMNFVQATLGRTVNIFCGKPIYHYAAPRGYRFEHYDWCRNRMLAAYFSGDIDWAYKCVRGIIKADKGSHRLLMAGYRQVIDDPENIVLREKIKQHSKISLVDWIEERKDKSYFMQADSWR